MLIILYRKEEQHHVNTYNKQKKIIKHFEGNFFFLYQKSGLLLLIFNDKENIYVKSVRRGFLYTGHM